MISTSATSIPLPAASILFQANQPKPTIPGLETEIFFKNDTPRVFTSADFSSVQFLTTEEPLDDLVLPEQVKTAPNTSNCSHSPGNLSNSSLLYGYNETADVMIASITSLLATCGLLGNLLALLYFWPKRKKSLPPFLYTIISAIDILKSPLTVPVLATLFRSRAPGIFENFLFCAIWPFLFFFLVRMSMFVTMLVSVTRTIVLVTPFREISRRAVGISIVLYAVFLTAVDIIFVSFGWLVTQYRKQEGFCEIFPADQSENYASYSYSGVLQIELLLPVLLVIFSFVTGTASLVMKKTTIPNEDDHKLKRVSITIAIFTAVFLLCSLPGFLLQMMYLTSQFRADSVRLLTRFPSFNRFLRWYGHLLSQFFLVQINAALNPCIYVFRMPRYRRWTKKLMKDTASILKDTVRKHSSSASSSTEWG